MCKQELVWTYEKKDGAEVLMGNNVACKIVGFGMVKIKIYDDIIRTFDSMLKNT